MGSPKESLSQKVESLRNHVELLSEVSLVVTNVLSPIHSELRQISQALLSGEGVDTSAMEETLRDMPDRINGLMEELKQKNRNNAELFKDVKNLWTTNMGPIEILAVVQSKKGHMEARIKRNLGGYIREQSVPFTTLKTQARNPEDAPEEYARDVQYFKDVTAFMEQFRDRQFLEPFLLEHADWNIDEYPSVLSFRDNLRVQFSWNDPNELTRRAQELVPRVINNSKNKVNFKNIANEVLGKRTEIISGTKTMDDQKNQIGIMAAKALVSFCYRDAYEQLIVELTQKIKHSNKDLNENKEE